jgi:hypothetical protein
MRGFFFFVTICTFLISLSVEARVVYLLDFDGTITDDQSDLTSWRTPWILRRIDRRRSLLQPSPEEFDLPETFEITFQEHRRLASLLGKGDGLIGSLTPLTLEPDPLRGGEPITFIPGYYAVDDRITFKYYRPARRRQKSYLVNDLQEAIARADVMNAEKMEILGRPLREEEKYRWKGYGFPLLKKALASPYTVSDLVIFTARWHADWEFQQFLSLLKKQGLIENDRGRSRNNRVSWPRFHSLNEPEALQFGRYDLGEKKANVLLAEAASLLNSPGVTHEELSSDSLEAKMGIKRRVHTMIVGEDDPRYLDTLRKTMEALSGELYYTHKIKFILLNTGSDADVARARWPWRWTVFHKGFGREALPEEITAWNAIDCEPVLEGAL